MNIALPGRYTRTAIILHWLIAVLVLLNIVIAWTFDHWPDSIAQQVTDTHKSIGIVVLGLALMRVFWRLGHPPPPQEPDITIAERRAAVAIHGLLYFLILALPLSGWMYDSAWKDGPSFPIQFFGLFTWPRIGLIANQPAAIKAKLDTILGAVHTGAGYVFYAAFLLDPSSVRNGAHVTAEPQRQGRHGLTR